MGEILGPLSLAVSGKVLTLSGDPTLASGSGPASALPSGAALHDRLQRVQRRRKRREETVWSGG